MRKAFTMIEIIFVIVIIGILAAVAIPKLAANRDNANGSMCTNEVGQLIHEISRSYTTSGYSGFKNMSIDTISNVVTEVRSGGTGIVEDATAKVNDTGITYNCDGEGLIHLVGNYIVANNSYELSITDLNPTSPAAANAAKQLRKLHGYAANGTRVFKY